LCTAQHRGVTHEREECLSTCWLHALLRCASRSSHLPS
jgi:hypothetical protein